MAPMFTVRTARPFTVTIGQIFRVDVQFNATVPGPVSGVVAVDSDDPVAPVLRVPLATSVTALGKHAELQVTPTPLNLGNTLVGTTVGQNVSIKNIGSRPGYLSASIVDEQPPGQFAVSTYSLLNPLPAGQTTSVYVSYTPATRGSAVATLAVDLVSDTDVPTVQYRHRSEVPLTGNAAMPILFLAARAQRRRPPIFGGATIAITGLAGPPLPGALLIPEVELTTLDFGFGAVNALVSGSFWIRNIGDAPLTVTGIAIVNQSSFGIDNPAMFPTTLQPRDQVQVPCNFNAGPVAGRTSGGAFLIYSDDPVRPSASLALVGHASGPHLKVPSELLDMGQVTSPASTTLTFTSDGSDPVTVSKMKLVAGREFSVSAAPVVPATLAPGTSIVVTVTVSATTAGPYQDQLVLAHDGNPSGQSSVLLRATVV